MAPIRYTYYKSKFDFKKTLKPLSKLLIGSSIISSIKLGTHAGCSSSKFSANDFKALNLKIEKIRPKLNIDYKSSRQKMYVADKSMYCPRQKYRLDSTK